MYAYNLTEFCKGKSAEEIDALLNDVLRVQKEQGSRAADELFIRTVGLHPMYAYNESYYQDVVNFDVAQLLAHAGRAKEASDLMSSTPIMANGGGYYIFPEHIRQSLEIYEKHRKAADAGIPPLLITSIPKSGSASLSQTISELTGAAVVRLSLGSFPDYILIESWLARMMSGGMVTHEHFGPSPHNLALLKKLGVRHLAVQLRDPRACLWSRVQANARQQHSSAEFLDYDIVARRMMKEYSSWMEGWLRVAESESWLTVRWIHFGDWRRNSWRVVADVLSGFSSLPCMPELIAQAKQRAAENAPVASANFNKGSDEVWREHASEALRDWMWNAMPPALIDILQLTR